MAGHKQPYQREVTCSHFIIVELSRAQKLENYAFLSINQTKAMYLSSLLVSATHL